MGGIAVLVEKWQADAISRADLVEALVRFEYQPDRGPPGDLSSWGDIGGFGGDDTFYELLLAGVLGTLPQDLVEEVHERLWDSAHPA